MLSVSRHMAIVIATSALILNARPVFAQAQFDAWPADSERIRCVDQDRPTEIPPNCLPRYARYYLGYAILAGAPHPRTLNADKIDDTWADDILKDEFKKRYGKQSYESLNDDNRKEWDRIRTSTVDAVEGWKLQTLPNYKASRPVLQVWAHMTPAGQGYLGACDEISIVFRSTADRQDILTDLGLHDYDYSPLKENIRALIKNITKLNCYTFADPHNPPPIVSVGTSLGGGLAQLAALSNDPYPPNPRIEKVFAFNTSNDIHIGLVAKKTREENRKGLEIDRVRYYGEFISATTNLGKGAKEYVKEEHPLLAKAAGYLHKAGHYVYEGGRSVYSYFYSSDSSSFPDDSLCDPIIRNVALNYGTGNAYYNHFIAPLVVGLITANRDYKEPTRIEAPPVVEIGDTVCKTLYDPRTRRPVGAPSAAQPAAPTETEQTQIGDLGVQRPAYGIAPTQIADLSHRQSLVASAFAQASNVGARQGHSSFVLTQLASAVGTQALSGPAPAPIADMGARRAHSAPPQTQLAVLDQRQAQVVSADARLTRVTDLRARGQFYRARGQFYRARGQFYALAPTQTVDLDHRQAFFASAYVPAANLGARRASSTAMRRSF
jgi:hypothetical protein